MHVSKSRINNQEPVSAEAAEQHATKVIVNEEGGYFCRTGWIADLRRAHVQTKAEAEKVIRRLQASDKRVGISLTYTVADYRALLHCLRQSRDVPPSRNKSRAEFRYAARDARQNLGTNARPIPLKIQPNNHAKPK